MAVCRYRCSPSGDDAEAGFAAVRADLDVPATYPAPALVEAEEAARRGPRRPPGAAADHVDRTDVELVTVDPEGARDLDQAFGAERLGSGYRVHYAIADPAAFVTPGGAIDAETRRRGLTLYSPDLRTPLHPDVLAEDVASLLPDRVRPALLWEIDLDGDGEPRRAHLSRALVRSREMLSYRAAQERIDAGHHADLQLLAEIGELRLAREADRDAVSLQVPSQEIRRHGDHYELHYDETLPVERWNAQISLLTGMCAARLMLDAGVGLLRTLPPADETTLDALRRVAAGLDIDWPATMGYAERLRTLDPAVDRHAALLVQSLGTLRGAGYLAFTDGPPDPPHAHSAIAADYAHVTAPLRRLCDRFANEVLLAVCADARPPAWAVEALTDLPSIMGRAASRDRALERALVDAMEALVLSGHEGQVFSAVVTDVDHDDARILVRDPAVIAEVGGAEVGRARLGERVDVRLVAADPAARRVRFERVG